MLQVEVVAAFVYVRVCIGTSVNILPSDCLVVGGRIACPLQWVVPGIVAKKLPYQHHLKALCCMTRSKRLKES